MEQEQGLGLSGGNGSVATQGVEQAKKLGVSARRRIYSFADEKKESLFGQADGWIEKISKVADGTGFDGPVGRVRDFTETMKSRSTEELVEDLEMQARQRPLYFLLGAFALGFLGARVLRDVGGET